MLLNIATALGVLLCGSVPSSVAYVPLLSSIRPSISLKSRPQLDNSEAPLTSRRDFTTSAAVATAASTVALALPKEAEAATSTAWTPVDIPFEDTLYDRK